GNIRKKYIKGGKFTLHSLGEGGPDVMWTEFVSADGLFLGGREALIRDLDFSEAERPIVAQFFTSKPEMMYKAAKLAVELGFDGVDINMGCPDKSIEKQGAGAAMIKNPRLAREVIRAAMEGAQSGKKKLPVSVKTRIGWSKDELETWLPELLAEKPAVITIHARTRKEMSKVPARWEHIKRAVEIRDELKSETLIFGNGDILDISDAKKKCKESGADGAMLGRAIFGRPWLFAGGIQRSNLKNSKRLDLKDPTIETKLRIMVEHTKLFSAIGGPASGGEVTTPVVKGYKKGQGKNFAIMKKHFKAYVNGWEGAKELRMELMETKNAKEVEKVIKNYLSNNL
ncbi:MAG: tRNA-dihydrouridine synthase, partial [Parcubacteria group bacterium]|nr:tRNA-dihydrouridine synthase [Parcubacteria group bacterium]